MRLTRLEDKITPTQLLPDLFPLGTGHLTNWTVSTSGGVSTLKYETAMANWGQGPFELRASGQFRTNLDGSTSQLINQRIYNSDGTFTDQFAGWFDYNPSDGYIHYNDMAHANIRIRTAGDGIGDIVATGVKTSYCLIDIQHSNAGLPGSPSSSVYNTCGSVMQGISVGWNDVYGSGLNGQSVNVTGIPNGNYWLEDVADPLGAVQESNEGNNATRIAITLSTLPTVGFQVHTTTPTGTATNSVSYVDVGFNQMVNAGSFTTAQATLTGPSGNIPITSIEQINTVTFRVHFAQLGPVGTYTLRVGPHIQSAGGVEMDQNNNGTPGETGDAYTSNFTIAAPRVIGATPAGSTASPVSSIQITYSKPVQSSTFNSNTIFSFTGPGGVDLRPQITSIVPATPGGLSASFTINFNSQSTLGGYSLVLEPSVLDDAGNPVDQNGDGLSNSADRFTDNFVLNVPGSYGPEAFGYDGLAVPAQSGLELVGQTGTTTFSFTSTDDGSATVSLGTNQFNFFGTTYTGNTSLYVSTNGLITFGAANTAYQNDDMSSLAQPAIAVLWDDWIIGSGSPQGLYKLFVNNSDGSPDRLEIEWNQIYHYSSSPSGVTFQAILYLNTGATPGGIFLNYQDLNSGDSNSNGASATVGIHKPGSTANNLLISRDGSSSFVTNNSGMRISVPHVLSITRESPNPASAPSDVEFEVTFDRPVTGVTADDFAVTATGTILANSTPTGANVHYILPTSDPAVWYAYVRSGYGTGTVKLNLVDDDSIVSTAGAKLGGLGVGNGTFTNSEVYTVNQRAPQVQGFTIGDGTSQRSELQQIVVTFDMLVSFVGNPSDAFELIGPNGPIAVTVDTSMSPPIQTVAKLTFSGPGTEGPPTGPFSLSDGNYNLRVVANKVVAGGVNMAADVNTSLFRFFGDVNGDRNVNGFDLGFFRNAFGTQVGDAGYLSYLDINGDGVINGTDLGQFRLRFGTTLP
jgi:hypothetical protein